jgi:hypothetical protein
MFEKKTGDIQYFEESKTVLSPIMESRKPEKGYDPNIISVDYREYEKKYKKYGIERKVVGHISEND